MHYLQLDKTLKAPLHLQLYTSFVDAIDHGILKPGSLVPAEDAIGRTFAISRSVVRQALTELTRRGYLIHRQGQGHFVRNHPIIPGLLLAPHTVTHEFDPKVTSERLLVEIIRGPLQTDDFSLDEGPITRIKRVHKSDHILIMIDEWHIVCHQSDPLELTIKTLSEKTPASRHLSIELSSTEMMLLLDLSRKTPLYILNTTYTNENHQIIAHHKSTIPAPFTELAVEIES